MRLLTRYVLREVASYALIGVALFTFILFMNDLPTVIEMVVRNSASLADALRIFVYILPSTLTLTLPTAVLAGTLLGLSRLAADSEITAMRACGIGALSFVRIVSILAFAALAIGLVNAFYFTPRAAGDLLRLEDQLKNSQASFEVQPRVFYPNFKNYVLYVQDVPAGGAPWRNIFLADLTQPVNPDITTARQAFITRPGPSTSQGLVLHLTDGGQHKIAVSPTNPNQYSYNISTFPSSDTLLQFAGQDDTHISRVDTPLHALSLRQLWQRIHGTGALSAPRDNPAVLAARIELNTRFSYPFACIVLMLIGVPLGLSSRRGGKSSGVVLTLMLVFAYYLLSEFGVGLAKSGKLPPALGVWGANLVFAAIGLLLLQQLAGAGRFLHRFISIAASFGKKLAPFAPARILATFARLFANPSQPAPAQPASGSPRPVLGADAPELLEPPRLSLVQSFRGIFRTSFPLLLDEYVLRSYLANLLLALGAFALIDVVFTFFELIGDIVRNGIALITVGQYLFNLIPYIVSTITPLCSLLAVLVTFSSLNRGSELVAMKASGISLYRVVAPVFVLAALLSVALFAFNETYLPAANRRQEQLRAEIKDRPPQTFLLPGRQFISGKADKPGDPSRIFYYRAFDSDPGHYAFADLTVFEFNPQTFTLQRRIYAKNVLWDATANQWAFDDGWQRVFSGDTIVGYTPFTTATFPNIREQPSYFKKEGTPSDEMNFGELSRYIASLRQSGFDTVRLHVQLERKLADPATTLVMAILAIPFALSMGRRGGLVGIAAAIAVAISYWVIAGIFSSLGDIDTLPPLLAAWSPDLLFAMAGSYLLLRTPT